MAGRTFVIDRVDGYHPWINLEIPTDDGEVEEHTIAIMDGDTTSWEYAD